MKKVVIILLTVIVSLGVFHTDVSAGRKPVKTYKWKNGKLVEVKIKANKKKVKPKKTSKYKPFYLPEKLAINERVELVTDYTISGTDKPYDDDEGLIYYKIKFKGGIANHIEDLGKDWDARTKKCYYYFLSKKTGKAKYDIYDKYNNYVNSGETEFVDMKRFDYNFIQLEHGRVIVAITNNSGEDFIEAKFGFDVYADKRLNSGLPYKEDHYRVWVENSIYAFVRGTTRHIELRGNGHDDGTGSYNFFGKFPYHFKNIKKIEAFLNDTPRDKRRGVDVTGRASLIAVDGHYEDILDPELNSSRIIPSVLISDNIKGVFKTNSPSSYADRLNLYVKATSEKDIGIAILEIAYFDNKDRCIGVYFSSPHSSTYDEKTGKHSEMADYFNILNPSEGSTTILEMTEAVYWDKVAYAKVQYSSVTYEKLLDMGAKDMRQFIDDNIMTPYNYIGYTGKYKGQTFSD